MPWSTPTSKTSRSGKTCTGRSSPRSGPNRWPASCYTCAYASPDGTLRYIDIWESERACEQAFEQRIHPAVDAAFGGNRPEGEPTVHRLDVLHADGALLEPSWS